MLSHPLSKVSETSIQPLVVPMTLTSSRLASPLFGPLVFWPRSCSLAFVNDAMHTHEASH